MTDSNLLFSIITPVYNRKDCIANCIRSVEAQQVACAYEHIVVDDGSTDGSSAIVQEMAAGNPRLVALQLPRNMGPNAARNAAIRKAHGRFIIFLDSDDAMRPGALATIAEAISRYPECGHLMFTVDYRVEEFADMPETALFSFRDFLEQRVTGDFTHVVLRSTMLAHPFDEELRIYEGIFFMSFYKEAGTMRFFNKVLLDLDRGRDDRVTFSVLPDNKETLRRTVKAIGILADRFTDDYAATEAGRRVLAGQLMKKHRFATMLGMSREANTTENQIRALGFSVPATWRVLNRTHMGAPFFAVAKFYIKLKFALGIRPK